MADAASLATVSSIISSRGRLPSCAGRIMRGRTAAARYVHAQLAGKRERDGRGWRMRMRRRETGEACERPVRCRPGPGPGVCGKRGEGRRYKIIWREAKREGGSLYNNYFNNSNNSHSRILSSIRPTIIVCPKHQHQLHYH